MPGELGELPGTDFFFLHFLVLSLRCQHLISSLVAPGNRKENTNMIKWEDAGVYLEHITHVMCCIPFMLQLAATRMGCKGLHIVSGPYIV